MLANSVDAWNRFQEVSIALFPLLVPTMIGLIYFFVTVILIPPRLARMAEARRLFDIRKRWIVGLLLGANCFIIASTTPAALTSAIFSGAIGHREMAFVLVNLWLIGGYLILLLARRRWLEIAAWVAIFLFYPVTYSRLLSVGIDTRQHKTTSRQYVSSPMQIFDHRVASPINVKGAQAFG